MHHLVTGDLSRKSDLADLLGHLREQIEFQISQIESLSTMTEKQVSYYAPFLCRAFLEVSLYAMVGRIDPFRVLIVRKVQIEPRYELGRRHSTALQWTGDVIPKGSENELDWTVDISFEKISRCLLGAYYQDVFWTSAMSRTIDLLSKTESNHWIVKLRSIDPKKFSASMAGHIHRNYSSLSKGVHQEFVVPITKSLDKSTLEDLINDSFRLVATISLVANQIPDIHCQMQFKHALERFIQLSSKEIKF